MKERERNKAKKKQSSRPRASERKHQQRSAPTLCYLLVDETEKLATLLFCYLRPIPVDSGLRFQCCHTVAPPRKNEDKKGEKNTSQKNKEQNKTKKDCTGSMCSVTLIAALLRDSASYFRFKSRAVSGRLPPPPSLSPAVPSPSRLFPWRPRLHSVTRHFFPPRPCATSS